MEFDEEIARFSNECRAAIKIRFTSRLLGILFMEPNFKVLVVDIDYLNSPHVLCWSKQGCLDINSANDKLICKFESGLKVLE